MAVSAVKVRVFCDEHGCQLPVAYLKEGMLIIHSRHHGNEHVTVLPLKSLLDKDKSIRVD